MTLTYCWIIISSWMWCCTYKHGLIRSWWKKGGKQSTGFHLPVWEATSPPDISSRRDTSTVRRGAACQRGGGIVLTRERRFDVPHHWWIMLMIPYCWHPQKEMFSLDLIVRSHACHSCIEQLLADFPFRSLNQSAKCNMLNHGFFLLLLLFW